ncbi:hypothetical protein [Empedobacter sp.]|uniref:hypothetical protein n=1 Tax=Empedobacter sp. TaxID=1927715 RepID=UPI000EE7EC9B|nr:hypothetical protein [Empedobacter sp.]HCC93276.1 hypothetical protein [Flavobacteriaceae bacterium]
MSKKLKYISFYNKNFEERIGSTAAVSKIDFVVDVISDLGFFTTIVSPSWTINQDNFFQKGSIERLDNHEVIFPSSFSTKNKIRTVLSIFYSLFWTFFYCLKNIDKNEKIIVYHTPWLVIPIFFAKKIKKFKVILEVEEVYSDVKKMNPLIAKIEYYAFQNADSFIFSNDLLASKLNVEKPYSVLYGNYQVYEIRAEQYQDRKIHLLYAGIIDFDKRGAFNALEAAQYLDEKYVLHIIGSGNTEELIEKINVHNNNSSCKVIYDGIKYGQDYIEYAQKCHIGLSTQKMDGEYLDTSFPSKIINYLGLGLNVISCNIKCVEKSSISNLVNFYYQDTPQDISKAIQNINLKSSQEITENLNLLNTNFKKSLKKIID